VCAALLNVRHPLKGAAVFCHLAEVHQITINVCHLTETSARRSLLGECPTRDTLTESLLMCTATANFTMYVALTQIVPSRTVPGG